MVCHCMHMEHGIWGIRRRKQSEYPREEIGLGMERAKMGEIPKEMKCFGYRGEESEGNTQRDEMFWVQRE
ncbi:MAG: hypothetical protein EGR90_08025 [Lachnospiraceae bacterium]|nr:hypothetical protein [Lachnospiraceae bacterium]